jgi:CheY-like chemotaxis protein
MQRPGTSRIKVVALTGRVGARERQECLEAGCSHYFSKPIEPRELLRQLPSLLNRPPAERSKPRARPAR